MRTQTMTTYYRISPYILLDIPPVYKSVCLPSQRDLDLCIWAVVLPFDDLLEDERDEEVEEGDGEWWDELHQQLHELVQVIIVTTLCDLKTEKYINFVNKDWGT